MLDGLLHFVLHQRLLVLLVAAILLIAGGIAWVRLPIDAFPDVTNVQVMILSEAEGLSPAEVERLITFPIETQMTGLPDVRQVRSLSQSGLSQVVVIFDDDVDIIHCHTWYSALAGCVLQRLLGRPLVLTSHSLEPHRPWKTEQLGTGYHVSRWLESTAYHCADGVIAVSQYMKTELESLYSVPPTRYG
jgi:glycosyltransferase involved in cell wall biosynthesis